MDQLVASYDSHGSYGGPILKHHRSQEEAITVNAVFIRMTILGGRIHMHEYIEGESTNAQTIREEE